MRAAGEPAARERPILFSAPMIRALLDGRKTQTRRLVKFCSWKFVSDDVGQLWDGQLSQTQWTRISPEQAVQRWCPYGAPGDRLWVKETWRTARAFDDKSPSAVAEMARDAGYERAWGPVRYTAEGDNGVSVSDFGGEWGKTRVSIHMPRWASRITLEVTRVRVERLQDITRDDCIAEGIERNSWYLVDEGPEKWFRTLWNDINGDRASWKSNPWVWVIEFRRVRP